MSLFREPKTMSGGGNGFSQKDLLWPGEGEWGFSCPNCAGDQMAAKRVHPSTTVPSPRTVKNLEVTLLLCTLGLGGM